MKFFLAFFVVLAMLAMMTTASPLPLASGGQINLPNEHCVCICQRGGYMGWLAEKIDSVWIRDADDTHTNTHTHTHTHTHSSPRCTLRRTSLPATSCRRLPKQEHVPRPPSPPLPVVESRKVL